MRVRRLVAFVIAATVVAVPSSGHAAVPEAGPWDSGGRIAPTVAFDVRGPAGSRSVQRVSVPLACREHDAPIGWATGNAIARVRSAGRFRTHGDTFVIRGRFVRPHRARVAVRSEGDGGCTTTTRRYVVRHRSSRVPVRSGRFVALVDGAGGTGLEVSAFGRMVLVEFLEGTVMGTCSDGSQRPLPLSAPAEVGLAAPIRPSGRFRVRHLAGSTLDISGSFDGGAVAALVGLSSVLPGGVSCHTRYATLVGALALPMPADSGSAFLGPLVAQPLVAPAGRRG